MADPEEGRSSPPVAKVTSDSLPVGTDEGATPVVVGPGSSPSPPVVPPIPAPATPYAVLSNAGAATDSGSATPSQPTSPILPSDFGSEDRVSSATGSEPASPPTVHHVSADALSIGVATATARSEGKTSDTPSAPPVKPMLQDPLGDVARKERRSLLGICIIAIFVGWTGLIPHEITNLGLKFEAPDRAIVQKLFVGVVTYYLIAFAVYAYSDILRWFYEIYLGDQEELKKRRDVSASPEPNRERPIEAPWSWIRQVPRASLFRGLFDLVVPLLIAAFAIYSLLFVIPIRTKTRSTPEPPCLNVRSHVTLDIRNG